MGACYVKYILSVLNIFKYVNIDVIVRVIWFIVLYQDQILSSNIYPDLIRNVSKSKKMTSFKSQEILQHHKLNECQFDIPSF